MFLCMKKDMNTLVFTQRLPEEIACREHYRDMRIEQGVTCKRCGGTNYQEVDNFADLHISEKSSKETTKKTLKWAHIAIGNAKRTFAGVCHKMSSVYLQNYLNEFAYKLNRRYCHDIFDRVIIAAIFPNGTKVLNQLFNSVITHCSFYREIRLGNMQLFYETFLFLNDLP
jgi:hypothetical protein